MVNHGNQMFPPRRLTARTDPCLILHRHSARRNPRVPDSTFSARQPGDSTPIPTVIKAEGAHERGR